MNFFDHIKNDSFFKPLTLKYRRLYYDCIQLLIEKTRDLPVLYEQDARDTITRHLKNQGITSLQPEEEITPDPSVQATGGIPAAGHDGSQLPRTPESMLSGVELQAGAIISLFRECGWLMPREIGRNGEYVVNITGDCRRIMDFLKRMTDRVAEGGMSNRIFAMYEIMKSAFEEDSIRAERPYTNILLPLLENELDLKNELTDLKESIADIMKAVIVFQDINSFGRFIMKDEMLDRFFSEYFFVKNNGLIPTQLAFIRSRLRELENGPLYEKMTQECMEKQQLSLTEAHDRLRDGFSRLRHFLTHEYEENMDLIDRRINNYYNLANTRIMLMASNGVQLEVLLNRFLSEMASMPDPLCEEAAGRIADCVRISSQKYIGSRSFEKIIRAKNDGHDITLSRRELSEEEKAAQTESLFHTSPNRYSIERVSEYLDQALGKRNSMALHEDPPERKEELMAISAAMMYSGNEEFPYQISLLDGMAESESGKISDARISRLTRN